MNRAQTTGPTADDLEQLQAALHEVEGIVPPLWPLKDYVAVNPFVGLATEKFLDARQLLRGVRDCELLMPAEYFRQLLTLGVISDGDIESAFEQCTAEYPHYYQDLDAEQVLRRIKSTGTAAEVDERRVHTAAEIVDHHEQSGWTSHIVNDITRHCSAHYDEGQSGWPSPWRDLSLFGAWRESSQLSNRMDLLGMSGFRQLVVGLPESSHEAIGQLLIELQIPRNHWRTFLLCELFSVAGWASFLKYRHGEAEAVGEQDDDLVGLLAIRLAYDVALVRSQPYDPFDLHRADDQQLFVGASEPARPPQEVLTRYVLQVAGEIAYRRSLLGSLAGPRETERQRKTAQMIFCIDVRSEVLRRHLESVSEEIETFGFAGFFGIALESVPLGESSGLSHCPVLLRPAIRIREKLAGADDAAETKAIEQRRLSRTSRKLWKAFQSSAISCFSFVESLGIPYAVKLLTDSLRMTSPAGVAASDGATTRKGTNLAFDLTACAPFGIPEDAQLDLAEGMLRNLGLTENFARIVAICGHASQVVNNPYKASLDCGACGGHSGEPNARVAAGLLNNPYIRTGLAARGIAIPPDTWFVPGVHNTTTDEIDFFDLEDMPESHHGDFQQLNQWIKSAAEGSRVERGRRMGGTSGQAVLQRSRDWSEVRPEWGLAGNAAFIVAPRWRTANLDLQGRAFLHSYDQHLDPDLKVLELIMTAPMIVTNWINLQYYASTVDNRSFGSGNKVIHNVVGQFGVLSGNGGDLMTGLPWQSLHDGARFQHEPLRLLVVIESTRTAVSTIVARHAMVRDLVTHGWLSLVVLENNQFHRWTAAGNWEQETLGTVPTPAGLAELTSASSCLQPAGVSR